MHGFLRDHFSNVPAKCAGRTNAQRRGVHAIHRRHLFVMHGFWGDDDVHLVRLLILTGLLAAAQWGNTTQNLLQVPSSAAGIDPPT
jgi:hypothetical protein